MSKYKRTEYIKCIGCHHYDNNELTGGIEIPMIAMYDSKMMSPEAVRHCIETDTETKYLMLMTKQHFDNILKPAVEEVKREMRAEYAAAMCNTE